MTRLCVIGNSHLAAMLHAWPIVAHEFPGITIESYGRHARLVVEADIDDRGRLCLPEKGFIHVDAAGEQMRARAIDLAGYDAFLIVGFLYGPGGVIKTYGDYHYFGLKGRRGQVLSRENFKKAARRAVIDAAGVHAATLIRRTVPDKPILIVSTPVPNESGYLDMDKRNMEPWRLAAETGDAVPLMQIFDEIAAEVEARGVVPVHQAEETLASPLATLRRFGEGAVKRNANEVRDDDNYLHMNAEYGAVMWRKAMSKLTSLLPRRTVSRGT